MILVKKNNDESTQKVISTFLKRVKKSNLVARKRKTQYDVKPISKLEEKKKAIRTAKWFEKQKVLSRIAK